VDGCYGNRDHIKALCTESHQWSKVRGQDRSEQGGEGGAKIPRRNPAKQQLHIRHKRRDDHTRRHGPQQGLVARPRLSQAETWALLHQTLTSANKLDTTFCLCYATTHEEWQEIQTSEAPEACSPSELGAQLRGNCLDSCSENCNQTDKTKERKAPST